MLRSERAIFFIGSMRERIEPNGVDLAKRAVLQSPSDDMFNRPHKGMNSKRRWASLIVAGGPLAAARADWG